MRSTPIQLQSALQPVQQSAYSPFCCTYCCCCDAPPPTPSLEVSPPPPPQPPAAEYTLKLICEESKKPKKKLKKKKSPPPRPAVEFASRKLRISLCIELKSSARPETPLESSRL
nr:hypothetical protein HmN_000470600 [Hymenolepis microstoma]